jgi:hypothetical protein
MLGSTILVKHMKKIKSSLEDGSTYTDYGKYTVLVL